MSSTAIINTLFVSLFTSPATALLAEVIHRYNYIAVSVATTINGAEFHAMQTNTLSLRLSGEMPAVRIVPEWLPVWTSVQFPVWSDG